jgi:hypothetical protein
MKNFSTLCLALFVTLLTGCGGSSAPPTPPPAPSNVSATPNGAAQVTVSWSSMNGVTGYDVYRSTTAGQPVTAMTLVQTNAGGNKIADNGLSAQTDYYYKVVANNSVGASTPSTEVKTTTLLQMGGTVQKQTLSIAPNAGIVSTFVGSGSAGNTNGTGTSASFEDPDGIATDGVNLYITDPTCNNIRKISIETGEVTTLAGGGMAGNSSGYLDGPGTTALFSLPEGITTDGTYLYVTDPGNHAIRKIVIATGEVSTFAGGNGYGYTDDIGTAAKFNGPEGITTDGTYLYVSDTGNHAIRKIEIATQTVSTIAGSGFAGVTDGKGTAASFSFPMHLTTDGSNLFIADRGNHNIRKIVISTQQVSTFAGNLNGLSGFVEGNGTSAFFDFPEGITTDGMNLYVTDTNNRVIRRIDIATQEVTTVAGNSGFIGSTNGTGTAARFSTPDGIASDGVSLYVTDSSNFTIRKIQ